MTGRRQPRRLGFWPGWCFGLATAGLFGAMDLEPADPQILVWALCAGVFLAALWVCFYLLWLVVAGWYK